MRKLTLTMTFCFLCFVISAQDLFISSPGDYVYYQCENKLIGIAYFNPNLFRIRISSSSTENVILDIRHSDIQNGYRITGITTRYGMLDQEDLDAFRDELQFILTRRAEISNRDLGNQINMTSSGDMKNERLVLYFAYWIPCLQLRYIENSDHKKEYDLVKFGRMKSENDNSFYLFQNAPMLEMDISQSISKSELQRIDENVISFSMYRNWKQDRDEFGSFRYKLADFTSQDAVCLVEDVDLKSKNIRDPLFFIKYYLLLSNDKIIPSSVVLTKGNAINMQFETYNSETKLVTLDQSIAFELSNNTLISVTLATYKGLYERNKDYFDTILQSVKIRGK